MKLRLLPSKAELRREHSTDLLRLTNDVEGLVERAKAIKRDLKDELPESRDAQSKIEWAIAGLTSARWHLKLARKALP